MPTSPAISKDRNPAIAVLVPCYNEAVTIAEVVRDFRRQLPEATILVYDNNSSDDTASRAADAGAVVRFERRQGKGFVVAAMFAEVEADAYVMVDGDGTYPADRVHDLLRDVLSGRADMVVGTRLSSFEDRSFRNLHVFGNRLVVGTVNWAFGAQLGDIMSGYRAFSRRFVREVPVVSRGFEIETAMTLQALHRDMVIREVPIRYGARPEGSTSKLRTFRDGFRVLLTIGDILKAYRPLAFFGSLAILCMLAGLGLGLLPVLDYLRTGQVARFPTAILASALVIVSLLCAVCGLILDGINHRVRELSALVLNARR